MKNAHTILLTVMLCLVAATATAQTIHSITVGENKRDGALSEFREEGVHTVTAIVDPLTFVLDNKTVVWLAGIDLPTYPGEGENPFAALAMQRMQALFLGQKVALFQSRKANKGRQNAMGQTLGHILKRDKGKEIWAQQILVAEGLARVMPTLSNPEGAAALYQAEEKPRKERKGLWGTQPWAVNDTDTVMAHKGTVQVVIGTVKNVATRQNLTYLNFGGDYKSDFTVVIDAPTRRVMLRNGDNPLSMTGKTIEVRGFVEDHNGPLITLDNPALLRIIETTP